MIRGIKEHLFSVLRDIVYSSDAIVDNPKFDLSTSCGITNAVFHIMRNAGVLKRKTDPRLIICWGGHSISRVEYEYTQDVGYYLGLRELDICTGCWPRRHERPHERSHFWSWQAAYL